MENLKKRWSVTYTKHIKQKRKVYQDGFIDLHISTNKVMLFDDCDKPLECKILKGEENVSSGETLTFNCYLVDVGNPEDGGEVDRKPKSDLNFKGRGKKIVERPGPNFMHRSKFRHPISSEDNNDTVEKSRTKLKNLSSSHKIIREFKKIEMQKYGALKGSPDTGNTGVTEWQVLYTPQMTQKAKKYHDGFLRLTNGGTSARQIMLYDASRNLLDSRFLKKDEIIRSHESVVFDAHLVDIGEPERENQVSVDLNAEKITINVVGRKGTMHERQNCLEANKCLAKATGKFQNTACSEEDADSSSISASERIKISTIAPHNKSLRDVHQILSILQKPVPHGSVVLGCTDKNMTEHISSAMGLQISDAAADYSKDFHTSGLSLQYDGPSENKDGGGSSEGADTEKYTYLVPLKGISNLSGGQLSSGNEGGNPDQSHVDNMKADTKWRNEAFASGFSSFASGTAPHGHTDDEKNCSKQLKSATETVEWPSFDLGF